MKKKTSFAKQAANYKGPGQNYGFFLEDVPNFSLGGKNQSVVGRICPDFERDENGEVLDSTSYVPFRQNIPEDNFPFTLWGAFIYAQDFLGHRFPNAKSRWAEVISPRSFDDEAHCLLTELVEAAKSNPVFSYLVNRWGGDSGTANSPPLQAPGQQLVLNFIRFGGMTAAPCVELGLFSSGATSSLFHTTKGLCNQMTDITDEEIAQNYLRQFACGDLTAPKGPVLQCAKDASTTYGQYTFTVARDAKTRRVIHKDITPLLDQRFDLTAPETWLRRMTDQEIVTELCKAFTAISPVDRSTNELEFIKDVLGDRFEIPDPPPAKHAMIAPELGDTGTGAAMVGGGLPTTDSLPFDLPGPGQENIGVTDDLDLAPPASAATPRVAAGPRTAARTSQAPRTGAAPRTGKPASAAPAMEDAEIVDDPVLDQELDMGDDATVPGGDPADVDAYLKDLGIGQ